jgi:hypothetical protein
MSIIYSNDAIFKGETITELPDDSYVNHLGTDIFETDSSLYEPSDTENSGETLAGNDYFSEEPNQNGSGINELIDRPRQSRRREARRWNPNELGVEISNEDIEGHSPNENVHGIEDVSETSNGMSDEDFVLLASTTL